MAVIQEAWINGVSTREGDELVPSMGLSGISKSPVSKLCQDIDERVRAFLDRPLDGDWPYLILDATSLKQREGGRIVSVAAIIAVAVNTEGRREIVGLPIGPSEAETFWLGFLRSLQRRGLKGGKLVVSDAHEGLKAAIAPDVLAYMTFPTRHRPKLHSTNTLERLNKAVRRRANVVGIFPNEQSIIRSMGAVPLERNDDWQTQHRYRQVEAMAELTSPNPIPQAVTQTAQIPPKAP